MEFKRYYNGYRANQAIDGFTPAECGRDSPTAEVISIALTIPKRNGSKVITLSLISVG